MNRPVTTCLSSTGRVTANALVSSGLLRLDLELETSTSFLPGQFAMLNLVGSAALVFGRPFSILAADGAAVSFLYRVVGRGTARLSRLAAGDSVSYLGPLGRPFPERKDDAPAILVGGGVGLPPVASWYARWGRRGDLPCFGARDGHDVPWALLEDGWVVSVEKEDGIPDGRAAVRGLVTEPVAPRLDDAGAPGMILACGPMPMLRAVRDLAADTGWDCWLSLEEHMGCGYGVCKGCVVPVRDPDDPAAGWRNATCCAEGPVFPAEAIDWDRYGVATLPRAD
jgi:dihydroorotate dehydrogenase electron transfer subunit